MAEQTAKKAHEMKGRAETSSELYKKMTQICQDFIKKTKTVVYGGTAINELLPKDDRFYNPEFDVPDYDVYSATPTQHAKKIVDIFVKEGFEHVEAKSAVHYGTYKVFVNFVPALDVTYMPPKLFALVQKRALKREGILYAHPDLLRQGMYVELSNPAGDVDRWKKVLPRLHKLNAAYPIEPGDCSKATKTKQAPLDEKLKALMEEVMISEKVVFLGAFAHSIYLPNLSPSVKSQDSGYYDILAEKPVDFIDKLVKALKVEGYTDVARVKHAAVGELVGPYYEFKVGKATVLNIFTPLACNAFNEVENHGKTVRIASFDTLLSFYFAFLYADLPHFNRKRILCMADMLFGVMRKQVLEDRGTLERFPLKCYGKQESMRTVRAHKFKLRQQLKKGTVAYNRWFFRYTPMIKSPSKVSAS